MEVEHDIMTVTGFGHPKFKDTATLTLTTRRLRGHFVNATSNKSTGLLDTCDVDIDNKLETIGGVSVFTKSMLQVRIYIVMFFAVLGWFPFDLRIIGSVIGFVAGFLLAKWLIKDIRILKIGLPGETYQIPYPYKQHEEFVKFTNEFRRAKSVANA